MRSMWHNFLPPASTPATATPAIKTVLSPGPRPHLPPTGLTVAQGLASSPEQARSSRQELKVKRCCSSPLTPSQSLLQPNSTI